MAFKAINNFISPNSLIPSAGVFRPTVIDKGWPIESIGSRLRGYTRTFYSGVRARSASRRTPPAEGIPTLLVFKAYLYIVKSNIFNPIVI